MITKFVGSFCLLVCGSGLLAQDVNHFTGTWEGKLNAGVELRIIFHIKESGGSLHTTADSPDQAAYGLKCDTTFVNSGNLTIEMHGLNATFTGNPINDSTIKGTFTQGVGLPLTLYRKKEGSEKSQATEKQPTVPYKITEISVPAKDVTFSGTLFQPSDKENSPVVLIIAGSGPTDRNGNSIALPGKNNSLLQLADSLARHGISSLRYDKRGVGKSNMKPGMKEDDITINSMMMDAAAMYDWLKTKGYTNIYVAGHSEGSLIGMMMGGMRKLKGFISIAGAGRKAGDILKEQLQDQLTPALKMEFDNAIDSFEKGLTVTKVDPSLASLLRPSVQPYMKSWIALDPQELIGQLKCPVLILQGTKDIQVKETDAQNLHQAAPGSWLVIIKNMNHVLKEVISDERADNIKVYSDPGISLAGDLVKSINSFINKPGQ
jgi:pimeloyl-ACP methyl ester carboxylesterase